MRAAHRSELIGMLTVESTVPGGPADGKLHTGDVLVQVGDNICTDFIELEEALDSSVGREMRITLDRAGQEVAVSVRVGDFHRVTPDRFLEVWGGVVHALSYQQARNFRAQCGLTYVAEPGYVLGQSSVPKHAIIVSLDKVPTPTVDAFAAALAPLQEGARVPLEYYTFGDRHRIKTALLNVTHRWCGERWSSKTEHQLAIFWSRIVGSEHAHVGEGCPLALRVLWCSENHARATQVRRPEVLRPRRLRRPLVGHPRAPERPLEAAAAVGAFHCSAG